MVDLKDLQDRVNGNDQLRKEFLDDPVDVLRREGLSIPPEHEASVRSLASQAKSRTSPQGASVAANAPDGISINIAITNLA